MLDKTGTLTKGKPVITNITTVDGFNTDEALRLVAAAEAKSSHPLAGAVLDELKKRGLILPLEVEKFENLSGLGVKALVEGKQVLVGTVRLMKENGIAL